MNFYAIPNFLTAILILITGVFAILKNQESKINFLFFLLTLSAFIWQLGTGLAMSAKTPFSALIATRTAFLGIVLIPVFSYHLSLCISDRPHNRLLNAGYVLALLFFIPLSWTPLILNGVYAYSWGYFFKAGKFHPIFMIFFIYFMGLIFSNLFLSFREEAKPIEKIRKKYFLIALIIAYIGSVDYLPTYGIKVYPFGYLTLICFVLIFAYAILKYHIMDITIALTRAGIFAFVYLFVLGVPFALGYRYNQWQAATWVTALLASAGPFIFLFLRRRAEDIIFKEQKAYQQALIDLAKNMTRIRDLDKLYRTIVLTVVERVRVPFAAIYLKDEHYQGYQLKHYFPKREKERFPELIPVGDPLIEMLTLKKKPLPSEELGYQDKIKLDSGLAIPCFMADTLLGFLVIGPKPGNRIYAPSDLLIFETLSYATALAIENSQFWREIEDRHRKARLQEMDTFSYSLAHEIDNPMTFVYNLARFLKGHFLKYITEQDERKEVEEACGYIMEGSERVMGMVKAIRQFGQKTTGELETLNLQEVIEGFFKLYAPELKAHFVICAKEMPDDAIYVKGVAAELQQVLMIFSKNSIHAMNYSQEKKLSLKLTKLNHSTARIAVSDTGCGIKKENLHTIFEPFFTTKASTEGTGMGLHNAKGFVLRHNGKIWAESEGEGKGATFIFELPILQGVNPEDFKKKEKTEWAF